jgi:glycosyltransferase involved in cell wall biosynthesis
LTHATPSDPSTTPSAEDALAALTRLVGQNPSLAPALAPALQALMPITLRASVVIPCFNERDTIEALLDRVQAEPLEKEVIVVDDCSTDGTREILQRRAEQQADIVLKLLPHNSGKGAAVQEGLRHVTGDVVIIQDADLEYDPADYPLLLRPIQSGKAKVVYGSRFLGEHKAMYFWHSVGNKLLTTICNVLFDTTLTDMETCYKVFTADIARQLRLREPRWGFDPEITARILRLGHRIYEVPISYAGREFNEGKKINALRDGPVVLFTLLRYRLLP